MDTLESLGWGPAWAMKFEPFADVGLCPGRVFAEQREIYHIHSQHGEALARVSGRLRHEARQRAEFPAVGDWVAIDATGGGGQSVIHALVPRFNRFSRKLAGKEAGRADCRRQSRYSLSGHFAESRPEPTPDRTLPHSRVRTTCRSLHPPQQVRPLRTPRRSRRAVSQFVSRPCHPRAECTHRRRNGFTGRLFLAGANGGAGRLVGCRQVDPCESAAGWRDSNPLRRSAGTTTVDGTPRRTVRCFACPRADC